MKHNIAEEITSRVLEDLEKGVMPWEKPWKQGRGLPLPVNAATKKRYRGINVFVLWDEAVKRGFSSPSWVTFNQAKALKGNVKKGEKGCGVVFYKRLAKTKSLNLSDEVMVEQQTFWILRTYTVFNLDQVEGLDHLKPNPKPSSPLPPSRKPKGFWWIRERRFTTPHKIGLFTTARGTLFPSP